MARNPYVTLPVAGGQLAAVPEVAEAARQADRRYGVNLLDDAAAREVVARHLRLRQDFAWHTEVGAMLVLGGIAVAAIVGASLHPPAEPKQVAALVAAVAAVPAGLAVWGRGSSRGADKQAAAVRYTLYLGLLDRARAAGLEVRVPADWPVDAPASPPLPTADARPYDGPALDRTLPVLPAEQLHRHPALAERARALGAPHGVDFLDERAVRALLTAQRRAVRRWHGWALTAALGAGLAFALVCGLPPAADAHGRKLMLTWITALAALGALATPPALWTHRGWRRSGVRGPAAAYLELLRDAKAYGVPVPPLPSWLTVNTKTRPSD
ncbi:hypothetical protein [Streptomyces rubellomurinus]|uniref:Uncharacterized protein n=1 Tax=Streptomyces rubellomurinus (strain ATCC 31215) TaxID=359131 RepID=A0A0F2TE15_STRR3|nr:hypothetical protein [Streptomyces rubellomurinus]KJS60550.1 hypothetical protein VM95_20490 [Streptomyces rubellomurinus]